MDFELSEEQRLLQDSVKRLLADRYGFEQRRAIAATPGGWGREIWAAFAELGILGLPFAEEEGGFGGGPVETMIVMEALGGALALEPYLTTVVLGGGFLRHGAEPALRAELAPCIAEGALLLAFAQTEPQSRYDLGDVATTARRDGEGWVIEGRKGVVLHGDSADKLVVTARTAGETRDRRGVGVFLVDAGAEGVSRQPYRTMDGGRAAEIHFSGVRAEAVLGDPEDGLPLVERVVDETIAALAAEAVGAMEAAHALTLDYLKTRRQFGTAIGSFQALQHRAADMMVHLEQTRSMAMYAAMMAGEEDAAERRRAIHAVKVQVGRAARKLGQEAIQLHGGIGMTMEYAVGHYFARLTAIDALFGDAERHLRQLSDAGGLVPAG
ncbi:acyl-CoA dehydrogenase family protein [Roseomonas sp. SSH11]|uniref:Acyl-CoA dehydrogenase family protein n=1 Tax=Pararoseomonas baculiformis TaxID=2820812 RepID=A0ABS4AHB5_9PROT|nr:acyl-CoA dehydrogenase family protein [Pararoseomonas baculiformis]MBP0446415.1 acyl-CoA dehydrogenase family protein [Pararoseomonas baculiformis]